MRVPNKSAVAGVAVLLGVGLLSAGCAESGGSADSLEEMEPVVLRVAVPISETSTPGLGMEAFADYARETSDGKLDFEFHYNGTLVPVEELLPGLSTGLADIGLVINAYLPEEFRAGGWVDQLATSVEDRGFPQQTISPAVQARFTFGNEVIREERAAQNIVPLWPLATGPYLLMCADPFETTEDLAGRTVRVGGEPWTTEVTNLGMTPSFLPTGEIYEGLQRGVIDCAYSEPQSIVTQGLMEVGKHIALIDGSMSSGTEFAINKDVWDELPLDAQQILFDAAVPAMTAWAQETMDYWKQMVADGEEMGVTFVPPTEIDQALQEGREAYAEDVAASAPSSVQDPGALRADFEEVAGEWDALWQEHLGIERADKSSLETALEDYSMGSEAIDWDAYEDAMTELLQPVRP